MHPCHLLPCKFSERPLKAQRAMLMKFPLIVEVCVRHVTSRSGDGSVIHLLEMCVDTSSS